MIVDFNSRKVVILDIQNATLADWDDKLGNAFIDEAVWEDTNQPLTDKELDALLESDPEIPFKWLGDYGSHEEGEF